MTLAELASLRLAILGFGREGQACQGVLQAHGLSHSPTVWTESGPTPDTDCARVEAFDDRLADFDVVIRSPGIPDTHPALEGYRARGGRVVNPSSIWFAERPEVPVIGVTGSKGKSTTTALLGHLLQAMGQHVVVAGNIGEPLVGLLARPDCETLDGVVAELSSFQLTDVVGRLRLGIITRLFPEHTDWHGGVAPYYAAKARLFDLADPNPVLVNAADPVLMAAYAGRANLYPCHPTRPDPAAPIVHDGHRIMAESDVWIEAEALPLPGRHNLDNAVMALSAVATLGLDAHIASQALADFTPLAHRLEVVHQTASAVWINDSIATSPHATRAALEALIDRDVVLIVGGQDRGGDWAVVMEHLQSHPIKALVTLPECGPAIAQTLSDAGVISPARISQARDMGEAVAQADDWARQSPSAAPVAVLLSPGSPSFGQFSDFEDRGRQFVKAVTAYCSR